MHNNNSHVLARSYNDFEKAILSLTKVQSIRDAAEKDVSAIAENYLNSGNCPKELYDLYMRTSSNLERKQVEVSIASMAVSVAKESIRSVQGEKNMAFEVP